MIRSTFAGFTTAQLGMRANQYALNVTGQNISNINTQGYTRQKLDQISLNLYGPGQYTSVNSTIIGYGVLVTGVSQYRDPMLDIQYRNQIAKVGEQDSKLSVLDKLSGVLDEIGKSTGIDAQFQDLIDELNKMLENAGDSNQNGIIRSSVQVLTNMFNDYANQLEDIRSTLEESFVLEDTTGLGLDKPGSALNEVNDLMKEIQELNISIKRAQINGHAALELQDQRNLAIDKLSQYVNINATTTYSTQITGREVGYTTIDMVDADGNTYRLIDDVTTPAEFTASKNADGEMILYVQQSGHSVSEEVVPKTGSLKGSLDMLNHSGEFDNPATTNHGIGYYQKMLDSLASSFAEVLNMNNIAEKNPDGTVVSDALLVSSDGSAQITASNITISEDWMKGKVTLHPHPDGEPSGSNSNISAIINTLIGKTNEFYSESGSLVYTGSYQGCFSNMANILNLDQKSTSSILDNYLSTATEIDDSRASISGVSLDEEGINILKYQKAFQASARMMTALDEALNVIINNMGVVGR